MFQGLCSWQTEIKSNQIRVFQYNPWSLLSNKLSKEICLHARITDTVVFLLICCFVILKLWSKRAKQGTGCVPRVMSTSKFVARHPLVVFVLFCCCGKPQKQICLKIQWISTILVFRAHASYYTIHLGWSASRGARLELPMLCLHPGDMPLQAAC